MFPEVVDFPRCNNADIDWYIRRPTGLSLVDPKAEMQHEEEGATLGPTLPATDSFQIKICRYVSWNKSNTML